MPAIDHKAALAGTTASAISRPRVLLTALGVRPQQTNYAIGEATAQAEHAPLALIELLGPTERPCQVIALVTASARGKSWSGFEASCLKLEIACSALDIPEGQSPADISDALSKIADAIPEDCELILDLTHGYRYLPFLFYPLSLYLAAFRGVRVVSAWYGKLEGGAAEAPKPLIRLDPLLRLPEWLYAVRVFVETGATAALAARFEALANALDAGPQRGPPSKAAGALREFSQAYELGLPLELGIAAGKLCSVLQESPLAAMTVLDLPLAGSLGQCIVAAAEPYRFAADSGLEDGGGRGNWKQSFTLTQAELQRQAALVDLYLQRNQPGQALALMREWLVSLGALYRGKAGRWLDRKERLAVERELGALLRLSKQPGALDDEQMQWAQFWDRLGKRRNALAHPGMSTEVVAMKDAELAPLRTTWDRIKDAGEAWARFGGGGGRLLVSPLGRSPGVLYSALVVTKPSALLVLCSSDTRDQVTTAIAQSGFSGVVTCVEMQDPLAGFDEIESLRGQAGSVLLAADEVVVNLTGGTTLMGIVVQRLFERTRELQRPSRRLLLTDGRPPAEQLHDPWQASGCRWLDPEDSNGVAE